VSAMTKSMSSLDCVAEVLGFRERISRSADDGDNVLRCVMKGVSAVC